MEVFPMKRHRLIAGLLVLVLAVFASPVSYADSPVDGREGRAEMRFLEGMIDHHQMALDMAADCLERAASESVVTLCQNIIDAQSAEIELMQGWLLDWYNIQYTPMSMMDMNMTDGMGNMYGGHGGHGGMGMQDGPFIDPPMMMGMFAGFNQVEGVDYEIAWLESMIDHHDDALHMAERLLMRVPEGAGHPELFALAHQIIADQTAEIELMEEMILELADLD
jgi:uncharacterized protein (DUF305 family)